MSFLRITLPGALIVTFFGSVAGRNHYRWIERLLFQRYRYDRDCAVYGRHPHT